MGEWGEPWGEESGKLGVNEVADGAGRLKYCVWIRSPNGVTDCEWGPLEEVGSGWNRK